MHKHNNINSSKNQELEVLEINTYIEMVMRRVTKVKNEGIKLFYVSELAIFV